MLEKWDITKTILQAKKKLILFSIILYKYLRKIKIEKMKKMKKKY